MNSLGSFIAAAKGQSELLRFHRGIEREALRVTPDGHLAETMHPESLGSKLTHSKITTDFSEAQLELITPVHETPEAALADLDEIHRHVYANLDDEILWSASMPCMLSDDDSIPLAYYGESNLGRLKTTYRNGLGYRYGRGMQTICAVHYNFSFPDAFWQTLKALEQSEESDKDFQTRRYFDLMRNFRRYSWLLVYLFGASPAVCNTFVKGKSHNLEDWGGGTAYLPHATSLRSGNLGYQSDTQSEQLNICYNTLTDYVQTLASAICEPHGPYEEIGGFVDGEYRQVNTNILQSEAEFYSSIRAKRVPPPGENFLQVLLDHGVQYIEVRLLDVNPYLPLGIDAEQIRFLDAFLLYCLLTDSPSHDDVLCHEVQTNMSAAVHEGRHPDLTLMDAGSERNLGEWASEILNQMVQVAAVLDPLDETNAYSTALEAMLQRINDSDLTPSGRILNDLRASGEPFFRFAMNQALAHRDEFQSQPLTAAAADQFEQLAQTSREGQNRIDASEGPDFDEYLKTIADSYLPLRQLT